MEETQVSKVVQIGAEWLNERAGGLNRYTQGICDGLVDSGVNQRWLVMADSILPDNVTPVASPQSSLLHRWRKMREAWPTAASGANVVASHFALYGFPVLDRLRRMPHVVHFHGPWAGESAAEGASAFAKSMKHLMEVSVYNTGDKFIVLSEAFKSLLCERYNVEPDKVSVIPGGVDTSKFTSTLSRREARQQLGWSEDQPTILCVRRLVHRMGLENLLAAFENVLIRHPEARLLIAGKGPLGNVLKDAIYRRGLDQSIVLLGFVPDDDLPIAYRAADLSIVPTESLEGFGLIIPESLASGTPALVTPIGGMPEVVRDLSSNLVLSGSGADAISEGIIAALSGHLALPNCDECENYARERFDWSRIAEKVLAVYCKAIECHA